MNTTTEVKKGDIGVRLQNRYVSVSGEDNKGTMYKADRDYDNQGRFPYDSTRSMPKWRPATPKEITAYTAGCRHIDDIHNYENSEMYNIY